jgi:RNA polymerase sigma-70 factor (ECF subfamily)
MLYRDSLGLSCETLVTIGDRFAGIMEGARKGDRQAITALYLDASPVLLKYLRAREPQEAEDLCSEIWMQLARQLPRFEGNESQWWGFVFLVARRCLNDYWKRRRRRRTDPVAPESLADRPDLADVEASALQSVATDQAVAFVTSSLTPEQADVILLRVVAGLDAEEVGLAIGKRAASVRVIQHRALRRLANCLSSGAQGAPPGRPVLTTHPFLERKLT